MPTSTRFPVIFLPHGGGPWPFVDLGLDQGEFDQLADYLRSVPGFAPSAPKALLVISGHWEEKLPTVTTSEHPPLIYDYSGFPPESYRIAWPAPGDPALARRVRELLGAAGIESAENATRGFDHGTFIPLKLAYPRADVPTVQLSLERGLDPERHLAIGRALAPLRDEGVSIIGSGMSFHNLRAFGDSHAREPSRRFDDWLRETVTAGKDERERRLLQWSQAPDAHFVHPREEHLLPLMVAAGAGGFDRGTVAYNGTYMGMRLSAVHFA